MNKKKLGFLLETINRYGTEYIQARVVAVEEGKAPLYPVGLNNSYTMSPAYNDEYPAKVRGKALDGVQLQSFVSDYSHKVHPFSPVVYDNGRLDARECKALAKTLDAMEKAMDRLPSYEHGDALEAAAKAIGAVFCCWRQNNDKWYFTTIAGGKAKLRHMVEEAERKVNRE